MASPGSPETATAASGSPPPTRSTPEAGDIIDYRDGTFTSQPAPARPGDTGSASGIVAVPGTGSYWATGTLTAIKGGTSEADILRYTR